MSLVDATDALDLVQRRYSIHPLTRAFAVAESAEEPETHYEAQRRLAEYIQIYTEEHGGRWNPTGFAQLVPELPNILAVIRWCWRQQLIDSGLHILDNTDYFLINRGYWNDLIDLGQRAIALTTETGDELCAARLRVWPVGWIYRHRGDLHSAENHYKQALSVFEKAADDRGVASAKRGLGRVAHELGELDQAEQLLREALDFYLSAPIQEEREIYLLTGNLADVAVKRGDLETAWELCSNVLESTRQFGDRERIAHILGILGDVSRARGSLAEAKTYWEEALENMRCANRLDATADTLRYLALVDMEMGQMPAAKLRLLEALDTYRKLDMQPTAREVEELLASLSVVTDQEL
jgi:LuxR family glucitol operon transcriptional activator